MTETTTHTTITHTGTSVVVTSSSTTGDDGVVELVLDVAVASNWHLFSPGSSDGLPVRVLATPASGAQLVSCHVPSDPSGELVGNFRITASVTPGPEAWEIELRTQACSGETCRPPERFLIGGPR